MDISAYKNAWQHKSPYLSDAKLNATGHDFCPNLVRLSVPHYLRLQVEDAETAEFAAMLVSICVLIFSFLRAQC
jgi:hypothetical protein